MTQRDKTKDPLDNPFSHRRAFTTDYTPVPVCPHCGERDEDWWDGSDLSGDGDTTDVDCGVCEKPYRITMHVDTSFCTNKYDAVAERELERIRKEETDAYQAAQRQKAAQYPPGTRVRINRPKDRRHGMLGVIANLEMNRGGFAQVRLDGAKNASYFEPEDIERADDGG